MAGALAATVRWMPMPAMPHVDLVDTVDWYETDYGVVSISFDRLGSPPPLPESSTPAP